MIQTNIDLFSNWSFSKIFFLEYWQRKVYVEKYTHKVESFSQIDPSWDALRSNLSVFLRQNISLLNHTSFKDSNASVKIYPTDDCFFIFKSSQEKTLILQSKNLSDPKKIKLNRNQPTLVYIPNTFFLENILQKNDLEFVCLKVHHSRSHPMKNRYLTNPFRLDSLDLKWHQAITTMINELKQSSSYIYSVLLLGSAARSEVVDYVSDLDIVVILRAVENTVFARQQDEVTQNIQTSLKLHQFISNIDFKFLSTNFFNTENYLKYRSLTFKLLMQSLNLYDTQIKIPSHRYTPKESAMNPYPYIQNQKLLSELDSQIAKSPEMVKQICRHQSKRLLRSCFDNLLLSGFTKTLEYSLPLKAKQISQAFPNKEYDIFECLYYYYIPTSNIKTIYKINASLGEWASQLRSKLSPN